MNRTLGRTVFSAGVVALLTGAAYAQTGGGATAPATKPKMAEEAYKNIQVLKGVPADQFIPTMQFIGASLGVECDFCHVQGAFEKDDKKTKQTARKMMQMMFAINKDNFDGHREVTCYSCHRGAVKPQATPVVAVEESKAASEESGKEKSAASLPSVDETIGRYIHALGGAEVIQKISSRVQKGKASGFGEQPVPIDLYTEAPGKRVSIMHLPSGDGVTAYNGKEGWTGSAGHPSREMRSADLDAAAMDADLQFALHIQGRFPDLKLDREENVGKSAAYVVVGFREGLPPVELYFDKQSALLVRMVRYAETALGRIPTQIDYADYREVGGVRSPFRWTIARPSGSFTIQVEQAQQNVTIDEQMFVKPPDPAPPQKN